MKTAILVGATGLIGAHTERLLWQVPGITAVRALVRRPWTPSDSRTDVQVVDFDRPEAWQPLVQGDVLFCCLGTTIGVAGSQEAFKAVDYHLPVACARAAALNGVGRMVIVSAMGADSGSAIFYNRVKGDMERDVRQFAPLQVAVARPSLLMGERPRPRPSEKIFGALMRGLDFMIPAKYKAIKGETVARAMIAVAQLPHMEAVYENDQLLELGK